MYIEKLPEVWQENWKKSGFDKPSLIQEKTYDLLKDGENLLAISPTGSGKTLAYLLPLLQRVEKGAGNQLLILLSSQELALQVAQVAKDWGRLIELNVQTIIGGANSTRQIEQLKKRPEVIVGTPGRVFDLIKSKKIQLMNVATILFDEADSLIESQTITLAQSIVNYVPKDFQLGFFSATGQKVLEQAQELAGDNLFVVDVTKEDTSKGSITQQYIKVPVRKKIETLRGLAHVQGLQAIVFFNQLGDLGNAEEKLLFHGLPVASLASDQDKMIRKAALEKFKEGKIKFLLTTDLLSRGMDIKSLPYVINFDVPMTKESFTHRTGRVGRMGEDGHVLSFVQDNTMKDLEKCLDDKKELKEVFLWGGMLVEQLPETTNEPVKKSKTKKKNRKNKGAPRSNKK